MKEYLIPPYVYDVRNLRFKLHQKTNEDKKKREKSQARNRVKLVSQETGVKSSS